jgi:hypothetical protein
VCLRSLCRRHGASPSRRAPEPRRAALHLCSPCHRRHRASLRDLCHVTLLQCSPYHHCHDPPRGLRLRQAASALTLSLLPHCASDPHARRVRGSAVAPHRLCCLRPAATESLPTTFYPSKLEWFTAAPPRARVSGLDDKHQEREQEAKDNDKSDIFPPSLSLHRRKLTK